MLATGGTDLKLRIINTITSKLLSTLDCSSVTKKGDNKKKEMDENDIEITEENEDSIESITFSTQLPLVACATLSGHVLVWDLNSETIRCRFDNHSVGYSKLAWSKEKIYAATLAGHLQIFDGRNLDRLNTIRCHQSAEILDFQLDSTRSLVCTASSDGLVKIFNTD